MSRYNKKQRTTISRTSLIAVLICFCTVLAVKYIVENHYGNKNSPTEKGMNFHIIDVGQGDSLLFTADGYNILIDAGPGSAEDELLDYIDDLNIESFDYVIATHPHEDHIGGMDKIIENYEIDNFIMTDLPENMIPTTKTYEKMIDLLVERKINVIEAKVGSKYTAGEMALEILAPISENYDDLNNFSVVSKIIYEDKSILLTGDAEKEVESALLNKNGNISCDILKVAHHGSDTSSSKGFLNSVNPDFAVISVGEGNKYGHPHKEVLDRLNKLGAEFYTTEEYGNIIFNICDGKIKIL